MALIQHDFTQISSSMEPLPDGEYECVVKEIDGNAVSKESSLPMVKVTLEVDDPKFPDYSGRLIFDQFTLQTKEGKPNKVGLGQLKAYAEATLGDEAANSSEGIDTDAMAGSKVLAVIKLRSWSREVNGITETGTSNNVKKILRVA